MKNFSLIFAVASAILSIGAQAQTRDEYLKKASQDLAKAEEKFQQQIKNPKKYVPCDAEFTYFEKSYIDWYQKNESEIWRRYQSLDAIVQYANQKIVELRSMQFTPILVKGQKQDPNITFNTALEYIADLQIRWRAAKANNQLDIFRQQIARPEFSPLNLGLDQVVETLKSMSDKMNESLRDRGVQFTVQFKEGNSGFELKLSIVIENSPNAFIVDLLSESQSIAIDEKEKIAFISSTKIENYSIDARLRYLEMLEAHPGKECLRQIRKLSVNQPYMNLSEMIDSEPVFKGIETLIYSKETWRCHRSYSFTLEFKEGTVRYTKRWGDTITEDFKPFEVSEDRKKIKIPTPGKDLQIKEVSGNLESTYGSFTCSLI